MPRVGTDRQVSQRITLESTDPDYGDCFRSQFRLARLSLPVVLFIQVINDFYLTTDPSRASIQSPNRKAFSHRKASSLPFQILCGQASYHSSRAATSPLPRSDLSTPQLAPDASKKPGLAVSLAPFWQRARLNFGNPKPESIPVWVVSSIFSRFDSGSWGYIIRVSSLHCVLLGFVIPNQLWPVEINKTALYPFSF